MSNQNDWLTSLNVNFVDEDFFVRKIRVFERQYQMPWDEFLSNYKAGKLENADANSSDYSEWAFLCRSFMPQLLSDLVDTGPPECFTPERQKPESNSGFSFLARRICSNLFLTSRPSSKFWQPTRDALKSSQSQSTSRRQTFPMI